jgi:hypothetical protein
VYDAGYASGRRGGTRSAARADLYGRRGSAGDDELDSRLGFQWLPRRIIAQSLP